MNKITQKYIKSMQTVCKFKHCLPQTLLGMLGCREVTVAINIISVCSCFVCLHNFQFVKTLLKKRIWESKDLPHRMLWYDVQGKLGSGIFLTKTESGTKTVTKVESENRIQTDWKTLYCDPDKHRAGCCDPLFKGNLNKDQYNVHGAKQRQRQKRRSQKALTCDIMMK